MSLSPLPPRGPGEGPDCHFPKEIRGFCRFRPRSGGKCTYVFYFGRKRSWIGVPPIPGFFVTGCRIPRTQVFPGPWPPKRGGSGRAGDANLRGITGFFAQKSKSHLRLALIATTAPWPPLYPMLRNSASGLEIGPPCRMSADVEISPLESGRNPVRKTDSRPGSTIA